MRVAAWNCRGIGKDSTVRRLKEIHQKYLLDIICLSETKQNDNYIRDLCCDLGFQNFVSVPPVGLSGGLVLFCKQEVDITVLFQSAHLIDCKINFNGFSFYFSCVYGYPERQYRHLLWERLERIAVHRQGSWFITGDFNEILNHNEKTGGNVRSDSSFNDFRQMIRTCDFSDIKPIGNRFSWTGKRGNHDVSCCLDRAMGNTEWHQQFPAAETHFLELGESDHRPLITFFDGQVEDRRYKFIYDDRLRHHEGFTQSVTAQWKQQERNGNVSLAQKLQRSRTHISRWKRKNVFNAKERINALRHQLDIACTDGHSVQERKQLHTQLQQAYWDEEHFWKRKSRNPWLRAGDRNTKYFHSVTRTRRIRNRISILKDASGNLIHGDNNIAHTAEELFNTQFCSQQPSQTEFDDAFSGYIPRVTAEINADLTKPVTVEEIKTAAFAIGAHKAPGSDGFTASFYHNFWDEIGPSIVEEVTQFFHGEFLDQSHNHTNICLIPKVRPATTMTEFRPIALCNVSYKIISKILVSRLKTHLPDIISENQNAFTPGRIISDNIIIAHEVYHALKVSKRHSKSYMALKTDITKAYDRLEWSF